MLLRDGIQGSERGPDLGVRACVRKLAPPNPDIYSRKFPLIRKNTVDDAYRPQ